MSEWWESHPSAGPVQPPSRTSMPPKPMLCLCTWVGDTPVIPDTTTHKFVPGSEAAEAWQSFTKAFEEKHGLAPSAAATDLSQAGGCAPHDDPLDGPDFTHPPIPRDPQRLWSPEGAITCPSIVFEASVKKEHLQIGIEENTYAVWVWLADSSADMQVSGPCELFGFGLGDYVEKPLAEAKGDVAPCLLQDDVHQIVLLAKDGTGGKSMMPVATALFQCERDEGIPDVEVMSHNCVKRSTDAGLTMFHRYDVKANDTIFSFQSKVIPGAMQHMKASELGAQFLQPSTPKEVQLPSEHAAVLWEVKLDEVPPATLVFVKPKVWLLQRTQFKRGVFYKLD